MTHPKTELTAEGAKYWLRSYHWSHVEAAYLLHGHDPRLLEANEGLGTELDKERLALYLRIIVGNTLYEIDRTSGPKAVAVRPKDRWACLLSAGGVAYACDQWPPAKWLEAARIANIPIPAVLSEAAPLSRAFTEEALGAVLPCARDTQLRERALIGLLDDLERDAKAQGEPFDRHALRYTKDRLHTMLKDRDRHLFTIAPGTFEEFWKKKRKGICSVKPGRRPIQD